MIGYALVGSNDTPRAKAFFDSLFAVVGATRVMEWGEMCMWGKAAGQPMVGVTKPYDGNRATVGNGTMIAIAVESRVLVNKMHAKALELGGKDEGAPGVRGEEGEQAYYGGYFRDLDGNKFVAFRIGPA